MPITTVSSCLNTSSSKISSKSKSPSSSSNVDVAAAPFLSAAGLGKYSLFSNSNPDDNDDGPTDRITYVGVRCPWAQNGSGAERYKIIMRLIHVTAIRGALACD